MLVVDGFLLKHLQTSYLGGGLLRNDLRFGFVSPPLKRWQEFIPQECSTSPGA